MNKNLIIGVLSALLILASLWGQVGTQGKKTIVQDKKEAVAALSEVREEAQQQVKKLTVKNEELQQNLDEITAQYETASHELVGLRKSNKVFEAKIAQHDATVAAMKEDRQKLAATAREIKKNLTEKVAEQNKQIISLQKQLAAVESKVKKTEQQASKPAQPSKEQQQLEMAQVMLKKQHGKLQEAAAVVKEQQAKLKQAQAQIQELENKVAAAAKAAEEQAKVAAEFESLRAQVIGLAKIVEEKNAALAKTNKELNNWKVNMNVLLARIADQQDALQKQREQNRNLVKELAAKNKELVQINEQLIQTPVKQ